MSAEIDRILDILDVGLQTSEEHGYGTDHAGDACARCQRHDPTEGGDLCAGCRAFLLGDTDVDPGPAPDSEAHALAAFTAIGAAARVAGHQIRTMVDAWREFERAARAQVMAQGNADAHDPPP